MRSTQSLRIVVTGLIAQHPALGGVAWDYLQYPAGLLRLGHDVYYFEDSGEWPYTLDGGASGQDWVAYDPTANVRHLSKVMERFGLGDRWAYRFAINPRWYGISDSERAEVLRSADLVLNVSGALEHPEHYRSVKRLAYIDSDPVFTQVKLALGDELRDFRQRVAIHDVHFSFGECLGERIPETGYTWLPTRQPILLDEWHPAAPHDGTFTTVMSWTSYKPLLYNGIAYGQKDREFARFLDLPSRVRPAKLEVAVGGLQHAEWESVFANHPGNNRRTEPPAQLSAADLLRQFGWSVVDPLQCCSNLDTYRAYIQSSKGELAVAKNGYVVGQPGWFSCRSACYLAAGRPAIVQDTGFSAVVPAGEGVVLFSSPEEAAAAIGEVEADYQRHAQSAVAIAHEYFNSHGVLNRLLEDTFNAASLTEAIA
jgi:hypothetical protein